jgi:hypothetical protein
MLYIRSLLILAVITVACTQCAISHKPTPITTVVADTVPTPFPQRSLAMGEWSYGLSEFQKSIKPQLDKLYDNSDLIIYEFYPTKDYQNFSIQCFVAQYKNIPQSRTYFSALVSNGVVEWVYPLGALHQETKDDRYYQKECSYNK